MIPTLRRIFVWLVLLVAWCLLGAAAGEAAVLALEESPGGPGVRSLRVGDKVALDELGPVVVNPDCTLRQIVCVGS